MSAAVVRYPRSWAATEESRYIATLVGDVRRATGDTEGPS
jgi:hypothetical protein